MEAFCLFFWRELWCWRETRFILYYTCVYNITHHMKFPPQKHLRLRFNTKRESISPSLHRNGVLKGLKRLTRVQCSWLCIFPSTIFGNPRCRINSELARVSCFFVHFFAVTARLHYLKLPNLTFSGRQKHNTKTFCFFFWTLIQSLEFNSRKIC